MCIFIYNTDICGISIKWRVKCFLLTNLKKVQLSHNYDSTQAKDNISKVYLIYFNFNEYFLQVKNLVKELRTMLGNDICLCIAGNKIDLEKERHVSVADAEAYVISFSLVFKN